MTTNLRGILAPALTAVTDNFQIHQERTIAHHQWLLENGCDGLVVFGTTSEANSFSVAERRQLLERNVQPPLSPLPETEVESLFKKLTTAGFDWSALSRGVAV
jgi:hypothetical protein